MDRVMIGLDMLKELEQEANKSRNKFENNTR